MTAKQAAVVVLAALAGSCGGADASAEVRVFAAASLTDVMHTIAADFEKSTGKSVKLNLAASSVLAKQIVEGAPCDVFLAADKQWADFVERVDLVEPGTRRDLLTNTLVVVASRRGVSSRGGQVNKSAATTSPAPAVNPGWTSWEEPLLDTRNRIAIGDPLHVPAGRYAKANLQGLNLWEAVEGRVIPCDSVRAALALVERGEAEAGIVYATDAKASKAELTTTPLPPVPGVDIRYPVLVVRGSEGKAFLEFLGGKRAGDAFRAAGFGVPSQGK